MNIEASFAPLLDLLLKSAALTLAGTSLLAALRKSSAANRHAASAAVFAALLLLPLTKLLPARWSFSLEKPATPAVSVRLPNIGTAPVADGQSSMQPAENVAQPAPRAPLVIPWKGIALAVWLAGAALLLTRRVRIALRLRAIVRGSFPIGDERLAARVRSLVNVSGVHAEVRESGMCPVPVASGFLRPVVLLPVEAADWSDAYVSSAMRHELGHIRRRDCITRLLADVLCALYWVNPLVWFAARRMRLAQEQACDDLVLNSGASAGEYAEQLVEAVRSLQDDPLSARHALAMAQPSTLETRVLAIVDTQRDRSARSFRGAFAGITFLAASLALCTAAQLRGAEEGKATPAPAAAAATGEQVEIAAKFIEFSGQPAELPELLKKAIALPKPGVAAVSAPEAAEGLWKKIEKMKGVDVLSTPRITTMSGREAQIEVGREFKYATEWDRDEKNSQWVPKAFETKFVGVTFQVEAAVGGGRVIDLHMVPEVTEFEKFVPIDKPNPKNPEDQRKQPVFQTRKMDTTVTIQDGQTVVLGGVSREDVQKVEDRNARTGKVQKREDRIKRQLIVLVTAHIVQPANQPNGVPKPEGAGAPVEIQAESVTFDKKTGTVHATGEVKIETAQATITARQAEIIPKKTGAAAAAAKIIFPKIDFRDSTLREAVEFLVAKSKSLDPEQKGVNVVLGDEGKAGDVRITLSLSNVPLSEVLRYVASLAGLRLREEEFAVVIGQPPEAAKPVGGAGGGGGKADTRWIFPKLDFRDATLREVVDYLVIKSKTLDAAGDGANIVLRNAEKIGDAKITLTLADVPLAEVLRYVAALANSEVTREEFAFVIGPKQMGKAPVPNEDRGKGAPSPKAAEAPKAALKKAGAIIFPKIDLNDATLSETVEFLRAKAKDLDPEKEGVNLILMPRADGADAKLTLSLSNIPLSEALRYVAGLANYEIVAGESALTLKPAK